MTKKTDEIGFYSLIQYCPNEEIGEVANIGVLLFAPKTGFVDVRVTSTNQRVARIFGGGIREYDTLQRYKEGLSEWAKVEHRKFADVETAKGFLASNANTIAFTPLRATVCPDGANTMLDSLFEEFFPDETMPQPEKPQRTPHFSKKRVFTALRTKYGKDIGSRLAIPPKLEVVGLERHIQPAFAFQSKHFHVVFPRSFNAEQCAEQIGYGLLILGEMKQAREQFWKKSTPIILGRMSSSHAELAQHIAETFRRYGILFFGRESDLIDHVGTAKPLPAYASPYAADKLEPTLFGSASVV